MIGSLRKGSALVAVARAFQQHHRLRTVLGICGIALAVLSLTLLAGAGLGIMEVGEAQLDDAGIDLWITGGPAEFTITGGGGFENTIDNAHVVSTDIRGIEGVRSAGPMGFQGVLVKDTNGELHSLVGTGTPGAVGMVDVTEGADLSNGNHYAGGAYNGTMTYEVILDERTANELNAGIGDTLGIGGSIAMAEEHEFTVVGISPTIGDFLGAPTVVMNLDELQTITGTTHRDPAALMGVTLEPGANATQVTHEINAMHPHLEVRSNRGQLEAILEQQAVVIGAGAAVIILAIIAGFALAANLIGLMVYQQRTELGALKALGWRTRSLAGIVLAQGLMLGIAGGTLGVALTPPLVRILNRVGEATVDLSGLVVMDTRLLAAGFSAAVVMGVLASTLAIWLVARLPVTRSR